MLICISVSHRTASFALLDRLTTGHEGSESHLQDDGVRGAVTISTCNRFETYLDVTVDESGSVDAAYDDALARFASAAGAPVQQLRDSAQMMSSSRVAAHLFAVTTGLESVAVGEEDIAGQVRRALEQSRKERASSAALEQLFEMASATSRGVRSATKINSAGRSMVRLALDLAESRIPSWRQARVLLIGTGAYARTTLAALRARGVQSVAVSSPSGRQAVFATREHVRPIPPADLANAIAEADLVITSTRVHVLDAEIIRAARGDIDLPLLIIDLGLPANVAKDVTTVPGVDLLDLETISVHAPVQELNASGRARDLVEDAAEDYTVQRAQEQAAPVIVAFRDQVEDLVNTALRRAKTRGEYSPDVERVLRHFASVLVHMPSERAREMAAEGRLDEFSAALDVIHGVQTQTGQPDAAGSSIQDPPAKQA